MRASLTVSLGERSYPIYIGTDLFAKAELYSSHVRGDGILVICDQTVADLYLPKLLVSLGDYRTGSMILPAGESVKSLQTMNAISTRLLEEQYGRDSTLIALGGGVIGDLAGFTAACYQRGIPYLQVPTTLLAQVDSSVGGKTAVNHPLGKNMIGAFHQPTAVIADIQTLRSLPDREFSAGLAEVIKYGLIRDADFLAWLERNMSALLKRAPEQLAFAVQRSCQNKAEIVQQDECERSGARALLNLGHSFAHAIETALGYGRWLHGEAVGAGLLMAASLSRRHGWFEAEDERRLRALLKSAGLPRALPVNLAASDLRKRMALDKKSRQGKLRLVLLHGWGVAALDDDFQEELLQQTLEAFCSGQG